MSFFKRKDPSKLQEQLASIKGPSFQSEDQNEWKPTVDKSGNGSAVIRFLPGKGDEGLPFVKIVNHGFKGKNGKWYIENCTSTHGDYDSCPVCKHISEKDLFNSNKQEYDALKRKTSFWANILIVKDPGNPENEGKVFKFRFGFKIMEKINAKVEVDESLGETPLDVTCPFEGANFIMKIKTVGKFLNYDDSYFGPVSEIENIESESVQKRLFEGMHDIMSIASKDKFNSYEKNLEKFNQVWSGSSTKSASSAADDLEAELNEFNAEIELEETKVETKPKTSSIDTGDDDLDSMLADLD